MAFLSSLIPALREIRGPLVAGYLWLVCAWLLFEPAIPARDSNIFYERLAELGEAIGPLGLAIVASVTAYLVGSLVQSIVQFVWVRVTRRFPTLRIRRVLPPTLANDHEDIFFEIEETDEPQEFRRILEIADPFRHLLMPSFLSRALPSDEDPEQQPFANQTLRDRTRSKSVWEIVERELSDSYRQLRGGVEAAERRLGERRTVDIDMLGAAPTVRLRFATDLSGEFVIPHFRPVRDLLDQIPLLQTRLLEISEATGARVERLNAEAYFRFTLVPPLVALTLILCLGASPLWLLLLVPIAGLAAEGIDLAQQGTEQLIDALRARIQTPELQQVTPVFERYRTFTTQLVEALERAQ